MSSPFSSLSSFSSLVLLSCVSLSVSLAPSCAYFLFCLVLPYRSPCLVPARCNDPFIAQFSCLVLCVLVPQHMKIDGRALCLSWLAPSPSRTKATPTIFRGKYGCLRTTPMPLRNVSSLQLLVVGISLGLSFFASPLLSWSSASSSSFFLS